jgi:hypothetical protein
MSTHPETPIVVPDWNEQERDTYIVIGRRRKDEHALGYAVVSVGAQLFENISKFKLALLRQAKNGKSEIDSTTAAPESAQGAAQSQ